MTTILFQNAAITVFYNDSKLSKRITMNCTATNPLDGKTYTKGAGWISSNGYLHSVKAPEYIQAEAFRQLIENEPEIISALKGKSISPGSPFEATQFKGRSR